MIYIVASMVVVIALVTTGLMTLVGFWPVAIVLAVIATWIIAAVRRESRREAWRVGSYERLREQDIDDEEGVEDKPNPDDPGEDSGRS